MEVTYRPSKRGWCKPRSGAKYSQHSYKKFLTFFDDGLRHVRLKNGRILTKYDWIDEYFERFEVTDSKIHPEDTVQGHIRALKGR